MRGTRSRARAPRAVDVAIRDAVASVSRRRYAGVGNPVFHAENTEMLLGDARDSLDAIRAALEDI